MQTDSFVEKEQTQSGITILMKGTLLLTDRTVKLLFDNKTIKINSILIFLEKHLGDKGQL